MASFIDGGHRGPRSTLLSTFRILSRPQEWMERWAARYGDPVLIPTINGKVVMTKDPVLAKWIFAHDPADFGQFEEYQVR